MTQLPTVLAALLLLAPPAKVDTDKLPYRTSWGKYTVVVEKTGRDEFAPQRLRVLDVLGAVVREIQDQRVLLVEFPELTAGGTPELQVTTHSGGAHCCGTDFFFTQEGGLRNLLTFDGRNYGVRGIKNLGGDARPEIIAESDVLAYAGDLPYAAAAPVALIIGWDGTRYVDQTRRYPQRSLERAREFQQLFLKARNQRGEFAETERRTGAGGYWANLEAVGRGAEAQAWLQSRLPASTRAWWQKHKADWRRAVASSSKKIRVSQQRVLRPVPMD